MAVMISPQGGCISLSVMWTGSGDEIHRPGVPHPGTAGDVRVAGADVRRRADRAGLEIEEWTAWPDVRSRAFRGDRRARSLLPDAVSGERAVVREVGSRAP
ncbi:hypothetical protein GCM10009854_28780 [Saccharopolyspora halophila]|uniref:Uncharacterized protein n=1 Tax=Saccharopolyspora halophila TaxID=405551 RepID=A0ABN3GDT2_9PSEU